MLPLEAKSDKHFIVFGGPNGAGKSTLSKTYLERMGLLISAFDWDARFDEKWRALDFDPIVLDGVRESTNQEFAELIEGSFQSGATIAYETNFHLDYNLELLERARGLGYRSQLFFLFLNSTDIAEERVRMRVKRGGHHVSKSSIRERFDGGLQILNKALRKFDEVIILDTSEDYHTKAILATDEKGEQMIIFAKIPRLLFDRVPALAELGITEEEVE